MKDVLLDLFDCYFIYSGLAIILPELSLHLRVETLDRILVGSSNLALDQVEEFLLKLIVLSRGIFFECLFLFDLRLLPLRSIRTPSRIRRSSCLLIEERPTFLLLSLVLLLLIRLRSLLEPLLSVSSS